MRSPYAHQIAGLKHIVILIRICQLIPDFTSIIVVIIDGIRRTSERLPFSIIDLHLYNGIFYPLALYAIDKFIFRSSMYGIRFAIGEKHTRIQENARRLARFQIGSKHHLLVFYLALIFDGLIEEITRSEEHG